MNWSSITLLICFLLLMPFVGYGQTEEFKERRQELVAKQDSTRQKIEEINERINKFEERLVLAEQKYDRLYNQYEDLNRVIALRDEKISTMENELSHIREEISVTEQEIKANQEKLDRLIENYKETLTYIYKHGRTSQMALILSAGSVNQMLVRSFYLNKFEDHRQQQAQQIKQTTRDLEQSRESLEEARERNSSLLAEIRQEKEELAEKREQQEQNVKLLRQDREQIESRLTEIRRQKQELDETLTSLIREEERVREEMEKRIAELEAERKRKLAAAREIENEAARAEEVAKYSEPIEREDFLSDEQLASLGQSFANQKGNLRWPVESSTISEHFGLRRHPVYGTVTENKGVEIVTEPKETVRVVHDGQVLGIYPIPNYGDVVVVKHGKYYTAYGNLSEVMVRSQSILEAGDVIGLSGDQDSAKGEAVFFMVREGTTNLDPEAWLANK